MIDSIKQTLIEFWNSFLTMLPKLLLALLALVIFYLIGFLLRRLFKKTARHRRNSSIVATFSGQVLFWISILLGSLIGAHILGFSNIAGSLLAGAGISAIIFGFAFKDILENFLSGFILAVQKPFKVGDIIEVDAYKGPVQALDLRSTRMRLADGRDIWIPNALIVKGVLTNYTRDGLLRHEFLLGIDMENDVEKARNLILDYIAGIDDVLKEPAPNVLVDEITGNGVNIRILFWIFQASSTVKSDPEARGESIKSHVMRGVKELLLAENFGLVSSVVIEQKKQA